VCAREIVDAALWDSLEDCMGVWRVRDFGIGKGRTLRKKKQVQKRAHSLAFPIGWAHIRKRPSSLPLSG